jgi:prolipoprotein diacylglyceryl transferase
MLNYITWTVKPEIFFLGNMEIRWYGLFFAIAFYMGLVMMTRMFKAEKVKEEWVDKLFIYIMLAVVLGARLGHVFFYAWDYYQHHLLDIFKIWEGGLASHGGAFGILIAVWIYSKKVTKRNMLWTLDRLVIPVAFAAILIRLGNLTNHEIYGHATDVPWAFRFVSNVQAWQHGADPIFTAASHPTQIYESLSYLLTFLTVGGLYLKSKTAKDRQGLLLGVFFIGTFLSRFLIEFIKEDQEAFEAGMMLNMGQWLSVPFVLAGFYLIARAINKQPVHYK